MFDSLGGGAVLNVNSGPEKSSIASIANEAVRFAGPKAVVPVQYNPATIYSLTCSSSYSNYLQIVNFNIGAQPKCASVHCFTTEHATMLSFLKKKKPEEKSETAAEDMNPSTFASKYMRTICKEKIPKGWTISGLVILCIDSRVAPTEELIQWMMEIVSRCNLACNYEATICDSKPGVVLVGSPAGTKDAANFGTYVKRKGFNRPGLKNICTTDDYTAKKNMKDMPSSSDNIVLQFVFVTALH
jgi:hypothetical protein